MIGVFLYFNALLYAVFAAWCTFAPRRTAEAMGYSSMFASGQSEYLAGHCLAACRQVVVATRGYNRAHRNRWAGWHDGNDDGGHLGRGCAG